MIDKSPERREIAPGGRPPWLPQGVLGIVCALVIGLYAGTAHPGLWESLSPRAADNYYNLLAQGFQAGQLSLKKDAPPGLAQLTDPYDPIANEHYRGAPYRLHDLSYYQGRLYLYFGPTPVLLAFWPFGALTGHYLFHEYAAVFFCAVGFLASVGVLGALWRRYFRGVSVWVVAAGALALGLATGVPPMLARCSVYEVAIGCGYMLTMLGLAAVWCALHEPERRWQWLVAASVAYGLALGARPSLLLSGIILLVPVVQAWSERRLVWPVLAAAIGPALLIGLGLAAYNALRFGNALEFGQRYQLTLDRQHMVRPFSAAYLWFNFRLYFLEPAGWSGRFPFVNEIAVPSVPAGHGLVEGPFGVLANVPLVWLAMAVPLAWRNRSAEARSVLRWFLTAVALLFGTSALIVGLYYYACVRYEVEFLPALVLLAVVGILGLERTLTDRPLLRCLVRCGWGLLLGFSVSFNLLANVMHRAEEHNNLATVFAMQGEFEKAATEFTTAIQLDPNFTEAHQNLAKLLIESGRTPEAIVEYQAALKTKPDSAEIRNDLGVALGSLGRFDEAIAQYRRALQVDPGLSDVHYNEASALMAEGKTSEAIDEYQAVVRIKPDPVTYSNLAVAFLRVGRVAEAVEQYQRALALQPNDSELHYYLGNALLQSGEAQKAIEQYKQALKFRPDWAEAESALARVLAGQGTIPPK